MTNRLICLISVIGALVLGAPASGADTELWVYLDLDNSAITGCSVAVPGGTFDGVEEALRTVIDTHADPPVVISVQRQVCISAPATFGPLAPVTSPFAAPWLTGVANGLNGRDVVETYFPRGGRSGIFRLGFVTMPSGGGGVADVLLTTTGTAGGGPILIGDQGLLAVPVLGEWGLSALAGLLILAGGATLLRRRSRTAVAVGLLLVAGGIGVAWAATVPDGDPSDWAGRVPLATDPGGDAAVNTEIEAVFGVIEADVLFLRVDLDLQPEPLAPTITSPASTTFVIGVPGSFTVTTTGFPTGASMVISKTGSLPAVVSFADNLDGTASLAGTPAAGTSGAYPITIAAANGVAPDASQDFTLTVCTVPGGPTAETCNGIDDDCNGVVDDFPTDVGGSCGASGVFPCSLGTWQCQSGGLVCVGAVNPRPETCNGMDDDCDGAIDSSGGLPPADSVGACRVPLPPPAGATSSCQAGTKACVAGVLTCQGAVGPAGPSDLCGVDANCDGTLTGQPDLMTSVSNCGGCGQNCYAGAVHSTWACAGGACLFQGCQTGYYDLNGDNKCEYACTFVSAQEACNGIDDNCNGQIDEGVLIPSPAKVCGVSPSATRPECTSGVSVSCVAGAWLCSFPAGVCTSGCAATSEICDSLDNDCDGVLNENVAGWGTPCASDDGLPPPGHGACRTVGSMVCNGSSALMCSALKADCNALPGGCTELPDGIDNDCDGLVDEAFTNKGANPTYFVKPVVTRVTSSLWIFSYEASRPSATTVVPGFGDGYFTSAPAGFTIDRTLAASAQGKIPWFNVSGAEAEQVCTAIGGHLCTQAEWTTACEATFPCTWGYNPRSSACWLGYTSSKFCNLAPFDFSAATGDQDGVLATGSSLLQNCWADWFPVLGNEASNSKIFDITGNLRELTKGGTGYPLRGGGFDLTDENGATCAAAYDAATTNENRYATGFRCCFNTDPTL